MSCSLWYQPDIQLLVYWSAFCWIAPGNVVVYVRYSGQMIYIPSNVPLMCDRHRQIKIGIYFLVFIIYRIFRSFSKCLSPVVASVICLWNRYVYRGRAARFLLQTILEWIGVCLGIHVWTMPLMRNCTLGAMIFASTALSQPLREMQWVAMEAMTDTAIHLFSWKGLEWHVGKSRIYDWLVGVSFTNIHKVWDYDMEKLSMILYGM